MYRRQFYRLLIKYTIILVYNVLMNVERKKTIEKNENQYI